MAAEFRSVRADSSSSPRNAKNRDEPTAVISAKPSLARKQAIAALGAYWFDVREHDSETIRRLEGLARLATIAIENARLLREREEHDRQRELMVAAGRIGIWSFDITRETLDASPMCRINFGRNSALLFSYADPHAAIHPDDRERVTLAIATSIATGGDYDIEYRLITAPGGRAVLLHQRCRAGYRARPIDGSWLGEPAWRRVDDRERERPRHHGQPVVADQRRWRAPPHARPVADGTDRGCGDPSG